MAAGHPGLAHPDLPDRLAALAALLASHPARTRRGTDLLLRSDHSFGPFHSACEAVWLAREAGLEAVGIGDELSLGGHGEFTAACAAAGLPPVLGLELPAADGHRLLALGITRPDDAQAQAALARLRGVRTAHCRELVELVGRRFRVAVGAAGPAWRDLATLAPDGNVLERHVAWAVVERIRAVAVERSTPSNDVWLRVVGHPPPSGDGGQFRAVFAGLMGPGGACHLPTPAAACATLAEAGAICAGLGAIPAAIAPGPDAGGLRGWCDRLASAGVRSIAVLPGRHSEDLCHAAVAEGRRRGWPVVAGSALDEPVLAPLAPPRTLDDLLLPAFRAGAQAVLAHQGAAVRTPTPVRI